VVDWGKAKWAHYYKGVHADFLKQDFEWAQEWLWYFNNFKVNTIESLLKVLDFAFGKGNGSDALMRFSILVGLKVSSWIPIEVINWYLFALKNVH
jgi:hypothetical protein